MERNNTSQFDYYYYNQEVEVYRVRIRGEEKPYYLSLTQGKQMQDRLLQKNKPDLLRISSNVFRSYLVEAITPVREVFVRLPDELKSELLRTNPDLFKDHRAHFSQKIQDELNRLTRGEVVRTNG